MSEDFKVKDIKQADFGRKEIYILAQILYGLFDATIIPPSNSTKFFTIFNTKP